MNDNEFLQAAIKDEQIAFATYANIVQKFGDIKPFSAIMQTQLKFIQELSYMIKKQGEEPQEADISDIEEAKSIEEAYEIALVIERKTIRFYEKMISNVQNEEIKDLFYRLQASSYNDNLPAFRKKLEKKDEIKSENQELNLGKNGEEFGQILQKLINKDIKPNDFLSFLNSSNLSLLGGVLVGGVAASVISQIIDDKNKDL
ncbi:hypothetical protein [Campylobacter geochelonis]|uniref:hypothetical protein n=1 Tax=Campylobacter geochelonis TaxID=1780362 RepID=UPI0007707191|nr:hypothetical protein [Campylobacter geochelonis]CZE48547.1 aminotransferase [Campylobacter geochelonis]